MPEPDCFIRYRISHATRNFTSGKSDVYVLISAARRGFKMVLFTASRRNNFVGGAYALPSALLVLKWFGNTWHNWHNSCFETRQLNTAAVISCPRSSCVMDLLALRTNPFLQGNGLTRLRASPCWPRNGLARTAIVAGSPAGRCWHVTDNWTDRERDGHNAPAESLPW